MERQYFLETVFGMSWKLELGLPGYGHMMFGFACLLLSIPEYRRQVYYSVRRFSKQSSLAIVSLILFDSKTPPLLHERI